MSQLLPDQTIILDKEYTKIRPDKAFYLRIVVSENEIKHVDLDDEQTLPGAVKKAFSLGHNPTHWMEVGGSYAATIPESIMPSKPAPAIESPSALGM